MKGLTTEEAEQQRTLHGTNEVDVKNESEWKKIAKRYVDWISLIIVSNSSLCVLARQKIWACF